MKLQKILFLAGLLLSLGLSAMQPLAPVPGLLGTDYSGEEPGYESEGEEFPARKLPASYADKPYRLSNWRQKTRNLERPMLNPTETEKPTVHSVGLAPEEKPLEFPLEYTEESRTYPKLPAEWLNEPVQPTPKPSLPVTIVKPTPMPTQPPISTKEYDIQPWKGEPLTQLQSLEKPTLEPSISKRTSLSRPLAAEPSIEPRHDQPLKPSQKSKEISVVAPIAEPAYTAKPQLPATIVEQPQPAAAKQPALSIQTAQGAGIVATLLGRRQQYAEFEVAILNSTNDTYSVKYNNQTYTVAPKQTQAIGLNEQLPIKPYTVTRTTSSRGKQISKEVITRSPEIENIALVRTSDNQQFTLTVARMKSPNQIQATVKISKGAEPIVTKDVKFAPPAPGKKIFYAIEVILQGNDLKQSKINIYTLAE